VESHHLQEELPQKANQEEEHECSYKQHDQASYKQHDQARYTESKGTQVPTDEMNLLPKGQKQGLVHGTCVNGADIWCLPWRTGHHA
jgi:hypothetical protein